jgi:ribose transport system substrate-binding protein
VGSVVNTPKARRLLAVALSGVIACTAVACGSDSDSDSGAAGSTSASSDSASSGKKIEVSLLNSFMGNTWRPVMMRSAELLAERPPLNARIESLKLVTSDNTAGAQNAALNNMLLQRPDLVLIDAASPTASNQTIEKVCKADVTVVSFDNPVTAPCAWKILVDFKSMGVIYAKWMAKVLDGKGTVFVDKGLPGTSTSEEFGASALDTLKGFPDIDVKTYYGKFAAGAEQSGVANLASSNKDVKGIISFAYGAPAQKALEKAGIKPVPMTTFSYNEGMLWCKDNPEVPCLLGSSPAYISGEAMRLGLDIIDGKRKGAPTTVFYDSPFFLSGTDVQPETKAPVKAVDEYAEPDLDPGTTIPLSPDWAKLSPEEVLKPPSVG